MSAYDAYAERYARSLDPTLAGPADRLAELAVTGDGDCVLDLATGTGSVARAAVARGARVVAVDSSPGMLAVAKRISPQLDFRVADAHALTFDPSTFDAVTCALSLSHFARIEEVLRGVRGLLRPGAPFVASAWGPGSSFPTSGLADLLPRSGRSQAAPLDEDTWWAPGTGAAVLREAGFARVAVTTECFTGRFANAQQALDWWLAWPLAAAELAGLAPADREKFLAAAEEALRDVDLSWRFAINFYVAMAPDESRARDHQG